MENDRALWDAGAEERNGSALLDERSGSAFSMTEPLCFSDATNIQSSIGATVDDYVINGRKWWSSGPMDRGANWLIVMGQTDPSIQSHLRQSMILVPTATPGVKIVRNLTVFGYDDAPHGHAEVIFEKTCASREQHALAKGAASRSRREARTGRIHLACVSSALPSAPGGHAANALVARGVGKRMRAGNHAVSGSPNRAS